MKTSILSIIMITSFVCRAQKISLDQLQVPTTPAITILDAGETNIESLTTTNAFSINNFNISSNALEITPYWLKDKEIKGYEFYGLETTTNYGLKQKIFDGIKKFSVSVAFVDNDSITNYSVGLRVNLLKIKRKKDLDIIRSRYRIIKTFADDDRSSHNEAIKQVKEKYKKVISQNGIDVNIIIHQGNTSLLTKEELEIKKEYDSLKTKIYAKKYTTAKEDYIKAIEAAIHTKPLLQLDFGAAYSFYNTNQFSEIQTGRYGIWTNLSSNLYIKNEFGIELSLHTRYLKDKLTILNKEQDIVDLGGKLSLQIHDNLTFSYEYIKRIKGINDLRSVGEIKYRLFSDKNIYLSGGFGRNFKTAKGNTISLLGIKWGIANKIQKEGANLEN